MKRILCVLGLAVLALTWGGSAFATTDQDTFNKLIAKVAPTLANLEENFKPKLACACVSSLLPGFVVFDQVDGKLTCGLPTFGPDGSIFTLGFCDGDFVVVH
jgi:hypothetical protein